MCSAAAYSNQFCRPQLYSYFGSTPSGANQLARSQPDTTPKHAPRSLSWWCKGEHRTDRAVSGCLKGQWSAYRRPTVSMIRSCKYWLLLCQPWNRLISTSHKSSVGWPSTIHSEIALPAPAALAIPTEFIPAATKKFLTPGASPSMYLLSGVKLSGTTVKCIIPASSMAGHR